MFMGGSLHRGDVNDIIYDYEGAREGRYGASDWADMGSREGGYWFR